MKLYLAPYGPPVKPRRDQYGMRYPGFRKRSLPREFNIPLNLRRVLHSLNISTGA